MTQFTGEMDTNLMVDAFALSSLKILPRIAAIATATETETETAIGAGEMVIGAEETVIVVEIVTASLGNAESANLGSPQRGQSMA